MLKRSDYMLFVTSFQTQQTYTLGSLNLKASKSALAYTIHMYRRNKAVDTDFGMPHALFQGLIQAPYRSAGGASIIGMMPYRNIVDALPAVVAHTPNMVPWSDIMANLTRLQFSLWGNATRDLTLTHLRELTHDLGLSSDEVHEAGFLHNTTHSTSSKVGFDVSSTLAGTGNHALLTPSRMQLYSSLGLNASEVMRAITPRASHVNFSIIDVNCSLEDYAHKQIQVARGTKTKVVRKPATVERVSMMCAPLIVPDDVQYFKYDSFAEALAGGVFDPVAPHPQFTVGSAVFSSKLWINNNYFITDEGLSAGGFYFPPGVERPAYAYSKLPALITALENDTISYIEVARLLRSSAVYLNTMYLSVERVRYIWHDRVNKTKMAPIVLPFAEKLYDDMFPLLTAIVDNRQRYLERLVDTVGGNYTVSCTAVKQD